MEPPLTVTDRTSSLSLGNRSSAFWLDVLESVPDPVFIKDPQQRIVWLNQACCDFMKCDRDRVLGKSDYDFFPAEEAQVFGEQDRWVFQTGITHENEERFTDDRGVTHIISTRKALLQDETGDRFIVGTIRDITDRNAQLEQANASLHAEIADRQQVEAELLKREEFLSSIYDGVEQLILVVNVLEKGVFRYAGFNLASQRLLGIDRNEGINQTPEQWLGKQVGKQVRQRYQSCVKSGEPMTYEECVVFNGRTIWALTTLNPIRNAAGKIYRLVGTSIDITDRKHAEDKLQQSQQLLQLAIDNIPQLIFWKDRNSEYLGCSQNFARIAGLNSPAEIVGKTDYDLPWTREESDWYRLCDVRVMESGLPELHIIETQQQLDGTTVWADTNKIPLRDANNNVVGILGMYEDITDRKHIEEALRQSEERFQKLAANLPGMLYQFMLHPDGSMSMPYVSSGCYELYEMTPEQIYAGSARMLEAIHPEDRPLLEQAIALSATTLQPFRWEGRRLTATGKLKWIQAASRPDRQADGTIVWDGLMMDVTQLKQAEAALQQLNEELESRVELRTQQLQQAIQQLEAAAEERQAAEAALLDSEEKFRTVYEYTKDSMMLLDDGRFIDGNPAALALFGCCDRAELVGKTPIDFSPPQQPNGQNSKRLAIHYIQQAFETEFSNFEWQHRRLDGSLFFAEVTLVPIEMSGKVRLLVVLRDITDRKRAEEARLNSEVQLRQQAKDLENTLHELQRTQAQLVQSEKMSSLGQLVAGVAHEINNPISFVYGNLIHATDYVRDLLEVIDLYDQYYPEPIPALQERIEDIELEFLRVDLPKLLASMKVGAERIREIVRSLRSFSRLDEAELKEVDLHEGLDSTLMILQSRLKAAAERPEIQVIKDYGSLPRIHCYAGQLNQVLMNVLANAIDAIEESLTSGNARKTKLPPHIQISTAVRDRRWVEICIADNGLGIPESVRDRLFDPFFTTKAIGKGTGLGLSIAHQVIVDKHEGRLEYRSTLGEGTEFIILLPLGND
jgi:PAS domain S-box-containing protein